MKEENITFNTNSIDKVKGEKDYANNLIKVHNDFIVKLTPNLREKITRNMFHISYDEFNNLVKHCVQQ